jgi:sulfonate transport system permease protein
MKIEDTAADQPSGFRVLESSEKFRTGFSDPLRKLWATGLKNRALPWLVPLAVLIFWQIGSWLGAFPETLLPAPTVILKALWEITVSGELLRNLLITFRRVLIGLTLGLSLGFTLGVLTGTFKVVDAIISPLIVIFRQIPMFAWIPMIILGFGIEEQSKIVFITIGTFYPMVINTYDGIKNVDSKFLEVGQVFQYNRFQAFRKIILPSAFPSMMAGFRFSVSMSWMLVVGAELLGSSSGVGFMMAWARQLFNMDLVLANVVVVGVIGIFINQGISRFEKRILRWKGDQHGGNL